MERIYEDLSVYDAERIEEFDVGDTLVVRGLTESLREQLVDKSHEDAILRWTPKDAAERFVSVEAVQARDEETQMYALVQREPGGSEDLAGLIWFSERPFEDSNYTFAIRLYEGYAGRGLAGRFMSSCIQDFARLNPAEQSIWLSVDNDNAAARHLYEKQGFTRTLIDDARETMTKVLDAKQPKVVVIGGGTGSFTVLSGLKQYTENITAVVNMADDGGSSGRLRDEHGILPPGDINQCLAALSENPDLRDMLTLRFKGDEVLGRERGQIVGHSWGNLTMLLLLQHNGGDFEVALEKLSQGLSVKGKVAPVTITPSVLMARRTDGEIIKGEETIGHVNFGADRPEIWLDPDAGITESARTAIEEADVVVIAPGNLYGSLAPALVVNGMKEALQATKAKRVYISNLVTKPDQTEGFRVHDFAAEIERFIGAPVLDYVLYNTDEPTPSLRKKYVRDGELMLEFDLETLAAQHYRAIGLPLIDKKPVVHAENDSLRNRRTLIRHDADLLAKEVVKLLGR